MGVYDRDWWRERYNQRSGDKKNDSWRRPEKDSGRAAKDAAYNPRQFRSGKKDIPPRSEPIASPPDVPGADWHWTVKLVALGWCVMILYLAAKWAMGRPL